MRKKLDITEGIFPMPVLMVATYNEDDSVNVMNAAWGTMQERGHVALNLSESHKTVQNIKARGAFTVSIADAEWTLLEKLRGAHVERILVTEKPIYELRLPTMRDSIGRG